MFTNIFSKRHIQRRNALDKAISPIVLENLELRRLYSTHTYSVPSGHTAAYLEAAGSGEVNVYLDSPSGTLGHTFTNTTGMDIVDAGTNANFQFFDQVAAKDKPTYDGDQGIKAQGGSNDTLEIDSGADDTDIELDGGNDSQIDTSDSTNSAFGVDLLGSSVSHLTLRTNDAGGDYVNFPTLAGSIHLRIDTGAGTDDFIQLGDNDSIEQQVTVLTGAGDDTLSLADPGGSDDAVNVLVDFGEGTGSGDGLGLDNTLDVSSDASATLAHVTGDSSPNPLVLDNLNVTNSGANLSVTDPATIGDLDVQSGGVATISATTSISTLEMGGSSSVTFEAATDIGSADIESGVLEFTGTSASSTIDDTLTLNATLDVDAGSDLTVGTLEDGGDSSTVNAADTATLTISEADIGNTITFNLTTDMSGSSDVTVGTFDASGGTVIVQGGGDLNVQESSTIYDLYVRDGGEMVMEPRDVDTTPANNLIVGNLSVLSSTDGTTINGTLDLTNNDLIVGPSGSGQFSDVQAWITNAYDGGAWDETGITSSSAATNPDENTALGYASGSELGTDALVSGDFNGVAIDSSTVVVKYTFYGDATLNGRVNQNDLNVVVGHFGDSEDWASGDFDYNGLCNQIDLNWVDGNFGDAEA